MFSNVIARGISTSLCRLEMMQITKMETFNKRGTKKFKKEQYKKWQKKGAHLDLKVHSYGSRSTGIRHEAYWQEVPEMIPELIVPDLYDCKLKPYVSYKTKEINQEELTSRDLFNVIYGSKIVQDFKEGKLDRNGDPLEPSPMEQLSPEEALRLSRQTGSDVFSGGKEPSKTWNLDWKIGKTNN